MNLFFEDKLGKYATIAADLENFFQGGSPEKNSNEEELKMKRSIEEDFVLYDRVSYKKKPKTQKTTFF